MAVDEPMPEIIISVPEVVDRMVGFGAETLRRCYQRGTCSVVGPPAPREDAFPRREMVRAQWGPVDRLAALTFARQTGRRKPSTPVAGQPRDREVVSA